MRKWTVCVLAALCVFGLFGCGAESVPAPEKVKDYAPADYEERFKGVTREALTEVWGEPADGGALQSADMWAIDDVSSVIIYWDAAALPAPLRVLLSDLDPAVAADRGEIVLQRDECSVERALRLVCHDLLLHI